MSRKKDTRTPVSQEESTQIQPILEQYHEIARALRSSATRKQAEAELTVFTSLAESAQMALLKALSKEHNVDAADVLLAINELSPSKSVRKEARRSLIRLEETRVYPQWSAPVEGLPAAQLTSSRPRFWKGFVSKTREIGEVQLVLCWEQGKDYSEIRILGFRLEFLRDGIKDFFSLVDSKSSANKLLERLREKIELADCSLAKGRRFIQEALAVNKKHATLPHKDYRFHLSLVNQLVLEAPDIGDDNDNEDSDNEAIDPNLEPGQVVTQFVEAWVDGDYELAYDFLSRDSTLREGLTRDEWIERREHWAAAAKPANLEPNFLHVQEAQKSGLWLPSLLSAGRTSTRKEIEVGWSLELVDTSLSNTLPELPQATISYKETGRQWFWTSYMLVQGEEGWRIQSMTDEGTNIKHLPIAELQKRIEEHNNRIIDITKKHKPTDPDADTYFYEILWRSMQIIYYDDALLVHLPLDREVYEQAAAHAATFEDRERAIVYLDRLAHQFVEERGANLRQIAALLIQLSEIYDEEGYEEDDVEKEDRAEHLQKLAEATLRESLTVQDNAIGHILLADLLYEIGKDLDEAKEHLHLAQALDPSPEEEVVIESIFAEIATEEDELKKALSHYQRVAEIEPGDYRSWYNIAETHQMLENYEEAETNYKRAIELKPGDIRSYYALSKMFTENEQHAKARELLENGVRNNPNSFQLRLQLSTALLDSGDTARAEQILQETERMHPDQEDVKLFREAFDLTKLTMGNPENVRKR